MNETCVPNPTEIRNRAFEAEFAGPFASGSHEDFAYGEAIQNILSSDDETIVEAFDMTTEQMVAYAAEAARTVAVEW